MATGISLSVRFWSKSEETQIREVAQNDAERHLAMRDGSWEEFKERNREEEESSEWTLERTREVHEKVAKDEIGRNRAGNFEEEHGLREADHCAGRWNGRSHPVEHLPALQQFSSGGQHLVGIDRTRRQQQQEEEALQLVVRGVWRQI